MRRIIKIREGKRLLQVAWLSSALHDEGTGTVILAFDPNLKPYLLDLKQNFVTYHLENIIRLKGAYSGRMYEILKSQSYKQTYEIKISDIK